MSNKVCAGFQRFVDLQIKIGRGKADGAIGARFDQHIRQNGDRVAAFHDRLDVAEAPQQICAFDRRLHSKPPKMVVRPAGSRPYSSTTVMNKISGNGNPCLGLALP
jgi:hypothetical protein